MDIYLYCPYQSSSPEPVLNLCYLLTPIFSFNFCFLSYRSCDRCVAVHHHFTFVLPLFLFFIYCYLFFLFVISYLMHESIIRAGITCKKISCYMHGSACRWLIVENSKIFRSYVKCFWIFLLERNCRILIGLFK